MVQQKTKLVRTLHAHDSHLVLVAVIFISIAFSLHMIGYASPGWYTVQHYKLSRAGDHVSEVHHGGLWYDVDCVGSKCSASWKIESGQIPNEINADIQQWWLQYQIEATMSLAASFCALVTAIAQRKSKCSQGKIFVIALMFLFALVSGISGLVASGQIAETIHEGHKASKHSPFLFPYSCFVFGLGSLAMCLAAIFLFAVLVRFPLNIQTKEEIGKLNEAFWISERQNVGNQNKGIVHKESKVENQDQVAVNEVLEEKTTEPPALKEITREVVASHHPVGMVSAMGGIPQANHAQETNNSPESQMDMLRSVSDSSNTGYEKAQRIGRPNYQYVEVINPSEEVHQQPLYVNTIPQQHHYHQRLTYVPSSSVYIHQTPRPYYPDYHPVPVNQKRVDESRKSTKDDGILGSL